ncbi:MAG: tetratricopeptide repeat protein [Anaerolineae bacterium]|nr:tetratricopeptide repeat protein [Anaerolineae bacterium]
MVSIDQHYISEAVEKRFVGRKEALSVFYQRFAYRHMKNVVYYYAEGGVGKTWILQKILLDNWNDPVHTAADIINFFDTQNQSIYGLQATIKSRLASLDVGDAFGPYDATMKQLEAARADEHTKSVGLLASLESRVNKLFIEGCQKAIIGREVILLFDTFERVQQLYVGQWMLKEFLPQVRSLIIAIVGRPVPTKAEVPNNVVAYELGGLELADVQSYARQTWPLSIPGDLVHRVWQHTNGTPLLIDLIFDLASTQFIYGLEELDQVSRLQDSERLKKELTKHFRAGTELDRVIWAMAFLRRRFDIPMLKHIVESGELLDLDPSGYQRIITELRKFKFVKEYPELESHLLHDEMQRMVAKYLLEEVDPRHEIRDVLYNLIVLQYYPKVIAETKETNHTLARQLQVEQLGYILDKDLQKKNLKGGLAQYLAYRDEIDQTHEYDFEELLWGEVRDHLEGLEDNGYEESYQRGQWLRRHNLFAKAENHYREMSRRFKGKVVEINKSLGFSLLRQGKIQETIEILEQGQALVTDDDFDDIADFNNLLGQAHFAAGHWDKALQHYTLGARAYTLAKNVAGIARIYVNRGYLYSLQGLYSHAIGECKRALELLGSLPKHDLQTQRTRMYAQMNLGTAYRHAGNYEMASTHYQTSLELAQEGKDQEVLCYALEQLGINACLRGRKLRRESNDLTQAVQLQLQAWQYLTQPLEMAQEADWRVALADGLSRMARVYEEIFRLVHLRHTLDQKMPEFNNPLTKLQAEASKFQPPIEVEYEYDLLISKPFSKLDWLEKAARLFELSALVADEINDFQRTLDSLMDFARLLVELKRYEEVPIVVRRTERIKGFVYQEELFSAMSDITLANLAFEQKQYSSALEKYASAYASMAKQTGYASYLLTDNLRGLSQRMQRLTAEMKLKWCDTLEEHWLTQSVSTVRPDMLQLLEEIRLNTLM